MMEEFWFFPAWMAFCFSKKKKRKEKKRNVERRVWGVCKEGQASAQTKPNNNKKKQREASGLWVLPPWLPIESES